jgi:hypothetical protein
MPIKTNLNRPPYNDTFSAEKDFHRWLFQPGVSVQARELNEIQSQFASQIERFGDNIFKAGTIVSGCNFVFLNPYPYVKLEDQTVDGVPASPSAYTNLTIMNPVTGLRAQVIDYADGFVSTDPDLKTLYIKYVNTGTDSNTSTFSSADALTVYDSIRNGIESVAVTTGGQGFSNSDSIFAVSALAVTMSSGTLSNGQYIGNGLGANVQIIGIDSTTLANAGQIILSVAPRAVDLANSSVNSTAWSLILAQTFTNSGNTASGVVSAVIGSGFSALPVTDALGTITTVLNLNKGVGYTSLPWITLRSANNAGGFSTLELTPRNYVAKVRVASTANSVGEGYAFGVNQGIVYLKGGFLRVAPQTVVVSKYDRTPNGVSVVFSAIESIVDVNIDPTLNDPAAGDNNDAPGADRLKIVPELSIVSSAEAASNAETLALVSWNAGNPYIQNQPTQYSTIGDEMARRTMDLSGDAFIDPFLITTSVTQSNTGGYAYAGSFDVIVDPGLAYIQGYRVQTDSNFVLNMPYQAVSAVQSYNTNLNYQNYLIVKELGGTFQFNTGDEISFYSTQKNYLSNTSLVKAANTTPQGTLLGTAQIRGLQHLSGTPGTNSATYALYVFDVDMIQGKAFNNVASVYYNGATKKGIADVVTTVSPTTGTNVASIVNPGIGLVWPTGKSSIRNINTVSYQFASYDQTVEFANSGILTKSLATSNWTYPWVGVTLTDAQKSQMILVPTEVDLIGTNAAGTWMANTSTANVVVNSSGTALTDLVTGDWVTLLGNSTQIDLKQVTQVVNNTFFVLDSIPSFTNTSTKVARTYPKNVPIPLNRAGTAGNPTANVSANGTLLTINVGFAIQQTVAVDAALSVPVQISNTAPTTKTLNRKKFVKLNCANVAGNTIGPWCLGVPDVFRLRGVYVGDSSVANTGTNYASMFSVDNNQNIDFLGLSYLYKDNKVASPLTSSSYILVEFDHYTSSGANFFAPPSYTQTSNVVTLMTTDATPLADLTTSASTWEIPEFFTDQGYEVDLLGCIDFRPAAANTVTPAATYGAAPVNPANTVTFNTNEKYFPVPGTSFSANLDYFVPRVDSVYIDKNAKIDVIQGQPLVGSGRSPKVPAGTMKIGDLLIPEYPNLPANRSVYITKVINTGIVNGKYQTQRNKLHSITTLSSIFQESAKVYTNHDVAQIEQRVQNLEYYVNLNQLETGLKTMVIPSSSDPTVNRYQFGFFADDFKSASLMDRNNPGYVASLEGGDVVPAKLAWEIFMGDRFSGAQSYIKERILSQDNATIGDYLDPTATPQCAVALANNIAFQLVYRNAYDYNALPPQDTQVDIVNLTLADATHMAAANSAASGSGVDSASTVNLGSGVVTLFFYAYDHPVQFEILQGNTVVANSATATALSAADVTNLTTGVAMNQWFNDQTGLYLKNPVVSNTTYVSYAGKITWNYSGAGGTGMSIKTTNGTGVRNWRWVLSYPINGETAGCTPPPPLIPSCPAGYTYNPATGGCVITPVVTPPNVVNIVWNECANHGVWGLVQHVLDLQAQGLTIGTITMTTGIVGNDGHILSHLTGTLADYLNPTSQQNQAILLTNMVSAPDSNGVLGGVLGNVVQSFAQIYLQKTGHAAGYYKYTNGDVYYFAPDGSSSTLYDYKTGYASMQASVNDTYFDPVKLALDAAAAAYAQSYYSGSVG